MNKRGQKPEKLAIDGNKVEIPQFTDGVGDEELTRFDRSKRKKKSGKNRNKSRNNNERKNENEEKNLSDHSVNTAPDSM